MATLVRARTTPLNSSIPTPFPREQLARFSAQDQTGDAVIPLEVQEETVSAEKILENEASTSTLTQSGIATPNTYTLVPYAILFYSVHSLIN